MPEGTALACLGLDHHKTPLALRERMAVADVALPVLLSDLRGLPGVDEAVVLSTCNRVEVYVAGTARAETLVETLADVQGVPVEDLHSHTYAHGGEEVVEHLFRVVSSLESMVVGEYQIVHQVKNAFDQARSNGAVGSALERLFQRALAVSKEVRNASGIGSHKVSVASVGVDLARQIHGDLRRARLLVVGAGEMAELAMVHLREAGVAQMSLVNRTQERASALAEDERFAGVSTKVLRWSDLIPAMSEHDIVLTSTAANRPIITAESVRKASRRRLGPLMFIDLAVPRDVETAVGDLGDVYRFDLDHLDQVVAANRSLRDDEVATVEGLVRDRVSDFRQESSLKSAGLLPEVVGWFDEMVESEFDRLSKRSDLGAAEKDTKNAMRRLGNKVSHRLLAWLREHPGDAEAERLVRDLLDL
jgi:glutamyl-tRNA reductase